MANPLFPDITGQEYDPLWARQMAEQDIPRVPAQYQQTPNFNLGPLHLNGSGVDAASLAVLRAMQNMPQPKGALGGLASGLVSGYAGARASQAQSRQVANEKEDKRVLGDDIERRKQAAAYGRSLAQHRWQMQRDAAQNAMKAKTEPKPNLGYVDITNDTNMQKRLAGLGYGIPPMNEQKKVMVPIDWLKPAPKSAADDPLKRAGSYNTIIDNVRQDPDVKDFITVRDAYTNGSKAAKSKTSAGDIILMRYLAKISDPTTGVREEEFKTFQGAQGALARVGVQLTSAMWGKGQLNEFGRQQLMQQFQNIYETKKSAHIGAVDFYRRQAEAVGINPDLVVRNFMPRDEADSGADPFDAVRKKNGRK